mgnify:CR=1 FL=1
MVDVTKNRSENVQTPEQEKSYPVYPVNPVKKQPYAYCKGGSLD